MFCCCKRRDIKSTNSLRLTKQTTKLIYRYFEVYLCTFKTSVIVHFHVLNRSQYTAERRAHNNLRSRVLQFLQNSQILPVSGAADGQNTSRKTQSSEL